MPEMLRTIIGDLLGRERDLLVVGASGKGDDALGQARTNEADVLITHDRGSGGSLCLDQILSASPISILAISDDGRTAEAVSLARRPVALNGSSTSRLADAVREIAEHPTEPGAAWGRQRPV